MRYVVTVVLEVPNIDDDNEVSSSIFEYVPGCGLLDITAEVAL